MYNDRLPPHDIAAEEAVIGSVLIDGDSLGRITAFTAPRDFWGEKNRWCFHAFLELERRGEAINQITVSHELARHKGPDGSENRLEDIGGSAYLSHLVMVVPTSVHIEHYARIVQRTSIMRQLIEAGGRISEIGLHGNEAHIEDAIRGAEEILSEIRSSRLSGDWRHIRDIIDDSFMAGADLDGDATANPVTTGLATVDNLLGQGMQRSNLLILAARPSVGKSALAFAVARAAANDGNRVGIFSLEMSAQEVAMRMLATLANVEMQRIRINLLSRDEEGRLIDAMGTLSDMSIYIDDTPLQTAIEIRSKARRLHNDQGCDLFILDYLQLIEGGRRDGNRVAEMTEISRMMKGIARDLHVPFLACSQLSRAIEQRPSHRPILSDLRESGALEQDADVVAFIHREAIYATREEWEKRNPGMEYPERIAELLVAKQRNGPIGDISLYYDRPTGTFGDLAFLPRTEG